MVSLLGNMEQVDAEVLIAALRLTTQFLQDRTGAGVSAQQIIGLLSLHDGNSLVPSNLRRLLTEAENWGEDAPGWKVLQALFDLFHMCVTCTGHINVLVNAGVISALLQFLKLNARAARLSQVCALKCLESITDLAGQSATALYRDHDGFNSFSTRLGLEVDSLLADPTPEDSGEQSLALWDKLELCTLRRQMSRQLLRNVQVALQCPDVANAGLHHLLSGPLSTVLGKIFSKPLQVGLSVFGIAVNILSHLIGDDPSCVPILIDKGLVPALLDSVKFENMDNSDVLANIPVALGSISLHDAGDAEIAKRTPHPLDMFLQCLIRPEFCDLLSHHLELPSTFGQQCEEILRNRPGSKDMVYASIKKVVMDLHAEAKTYPVWKVNNFNSNNNLADRLNSVGAFLESFLLTTDACQWFTKEVFPTLLEICHMPCLPFQFPVVAHTHTVLHVAKMIAQSCPQDLHKPMNDILQKSLDSLKASADLPIATPPSSHMDGQLPEPVDLKAVVKNAYDNPLQWSEKASAIPTDEELEKKNKIFQAISGVSTVLHLYHHVYRDINAPLPPATMAALANILSLVRPYSVWILTQHSRVPLKHRDRKRKPHVHFAYFTEMVRMQFGGLYGSKGEHLPLEEEDAAISGVVLRQAMLSLRSFVNTASRASNYSSNSRRSSRNSSPTLHVTMGSVVIVLGTLLRDTLLCVNELPKVKEMVKGKDAVSLSKSESFIIGSYLWESTELCHRVLLDDRYQMVRVLSVEAFRQVGGFKPLKDLVRIILALPSLQQKVGNEPTPQDESEVDTASKMDVDEGDEFDQGDSKIEAIAGHFQSKGSNGKHGRVGIAGEAIITYCTFLERLSSWKRIRDAACVQQMSKFAQREKDKDMSASSAGLQKLLAGFSPESICAYIHAVVLESLLPLWLAPPGQLQRLPQHVLISTLRCWWHIMDGPHHDRPKSLKDEAKEQRRRARQERRAERAAERPAGAPAVIPADFRSDIANLRPPAFVFDEEAISTLVAMGFSESGSREAARSMGTNSVEICIEWMTEHPHLVTEAEAAASRTTPAAEQAGDTAQSGSGSAQPSGSGAAAATSSGAGAGASGAAGSAQPGASTLDVDMAAAPPARDPSPTGPYEDIGSGSASNDPSKTPVITPRVAPPSPDDIFLENALKAATKILQAGDIYVDVAAILDVCIPILVRGFVPRMFMIGSFHDIDNANKIAELIANFANLCTDFIVPTASLNREQTASSAASDLPVLPEPTEVGWPIPMSVFIPPDDYVLPESTPESASSQEKDGTTPAASSIDLQNMNSGERNYLEQALSLDPSGETDVFTELSRQLMAGSASDADRALRTARGIADRVGRGSSEPNLVDGPAGARTNGRPPMKVIQAANLKWVMFCCRLQIQHLRTFFATTRNAEETHTDKQKKQMGILLQVALHVLSVVTTRSKSTGQFVAWEKNVDIQAFIDLFISYLEVLPPEDIFSANAKVQLLLDRGYTTVLGSTVFPSDDKESLASPPEWLMQLVIATQTLLGKVELLDMPAGKKPPGSADITLLPVVHQQRLLEACAKIFYAFPGCSGSVMMNLMRVVRMLTQSTKNAQFFLSRNCRYSFDQQGFLVDSPVGGLQAIMRSSRHGRFHGFLRIIGDIVCSLLEDDVVLATRIEHMIVNQFEGRVPGRDPNREPRPVTEMALNDLLTASEPLVRRSPETVDECMKRMVHIVPKRDASSFPTQKRTRQVKLVPASERNGVGGTANGRRQSVGIESGSTAGIVAYSLVDELMLVTHLQNNMRFACFQVYESKVNSKKQKMEEAELEKKNKKKKGGSPSGEGTGASDSSTASGVAKQAEPFLLPASTGATGQKLADYPIMLLPESMLYLLDNILHSLTGTLSIFFKNLPTIVQPTAFPSSAAITSRPEYLPEKSVWIPGSSHPGTFKEKTLLAVLLKRVFPLVAGQAELWSHQCRTFSSVTNKVGFTLGHFLGSNNVVHRQVLRCTQILTTLAKSPEVRKRLMVDCCSLLKQIADQPSSLTSGNNSSSAIAQALGLCSLLHRLLSTMPASAFTDSSKEDGGKDKDGKTGDKKETNEAMASSTSMGTLSSGSKDVAPSSVAASKLGRTVSASSASAIPGLSKMDLSSLKLSLSRLLHTVPPTRADVTELINAVLKCLEFLTRPALLPLSQESSTSASDKNETKQSEDGFRPLTNQSLPSSDMLSASGAETSMRDVERFEAVMRDVDRIVQQESAEEDIDRIEVMEDDHPGFQAALNNDDGGDPDGFDDEDGMDEDDDDEDDLDDDGMAIDDADDDDDDDDYGLLGFGGNEPLLSEQGFDAFAAMDGLMEGWDEEPMAPLISGRGSGGWGSGSGGGGSRHQWALGGSMGGGPIQAFFNGGAPADNDVMEAMLDDDAMLESMMFGGAGGGGGLEMSLDTMLGSGDPFGDGIPSFLPPPGVGAGSSWMSRGGGGYGDPFGMLDNDRMEDWDQAMPQLPRGARVMHVSASMWPFADIANGAGREAFGQPVGGYVQNGDLDIIPDGPDARAGRRDRVSRAETAYMRATGAEPHVWGGGGGGRYDAPPLFGDQWGSGLPAGYGGQGRGARGGASRGQPSGSQAQNRPMELFDGLLSHLVSNLPAAPADPPPASSDAPATGSQPAASTAPAASTVPATGTVSDPPSSAPAPSAGASDPTPTASPPPEAVVEGSPPAQTAPPVNAADTAAPPTEPAQAWTDPNYLQSAINTAMMSAINNAMSGSNAGAGAQPAANINVNNPEDIIALLNQAMQGQPMPTGATTNNVTGLGLVNVQSNVTMNASDSDAPASTSGAAAAAVPPADASMAAASAAPSLPAESAAPMDNDVTMDDIEPAPETADEYEPGYQAATAVIASASEPAATGAAAAAAAAAPSSSTSAPSAAPAAPARARMTNRPIETVPDAPTPVGEDTPMEDAAPSAPATTAAATNTEANPAATTNNNESGNNQESQPSGSAAAGSSGDTPAVEEPLYNTESLGIESLNQLSARLGVHGAHILSHIGADPTFLEALPLDMRVEAIGAQLVGVDFSALQARHNPTAAAEASAGGEAAAASGGGNLEIAQDILDALPPEMRAEAQAQMAQQAAREAAPNPALAEEMDNACFVATLDPELRREVLMTATPEFLASLPPDLLAEAQLHRDRAMQTNRRAAPRSTGATGSGAAAAGSAATGGAAAAVVRRPRREPPPVPTDPGGLRSVLSAFDSNSLGQAGRVRGSRGIRGLFGSSAADIFSQIFDGVGAGGEVQILAAGGGGLDRQNSMPSLSAFVNSTGPGAAALGARQGGRGRRGGSQDQGGHGQDDSMPTLRKAVQYYKADRHPPLEPAVVPALCRTVFFRNRPASEVLRKLFLNVCLHPKTMNVALSNMMVALVWRPTDTSPSPTGLPPLQLFESLEGGNTMTPATTAETVAFGSQCLLSLFGYLIVKWPKLAEFFAQPLEVSNAVPEFSTSALATGNNENWTHDFRRKKKKNSTVDVQSFQPIQNVLTSQSSGPSQIAQGITSVDLLIGLLKEQLFQTSRPHTVFLVSIIHALIVDPDEERREKQKLKDAAGSLAVTPEGSVDPATGEPVAAASSTDPIIAPSNEGTPDATTAAAAASTTDPKKLEELAKEKAEKEKREKEREEMSVPYNKLRKGLRGDAAGSLLGFLCNGNVISTSSRSGRDSRRSEEPGGDVMQKVGEVLVALARGSNLPGSVNHVEIIRSELANHVAMLIRDIRAEFEPNGEITRWVVSPEQRLLRLVKTLQKVCNANPGVVQLTAILQESDIEGLWQTMDQALEKADATSGGAMDTPAMRILAGDSGGISTNKGVPPALTKLLPLIEAFFLIYDEPKQSQRRKSKDGSAPASMGAPERESSMISATGDPNLPPEGKVANFCDKHKRVINMFVKQTPGLLSRGFAPMVKVSPHVLDFDNKRHYFRSKLKSARTNDQHRYDTIRLRVRRSDVFMDSYHQLRMRSGEELKGRTQVTFIGEEGVDAGGLVREWFDILAREMLNPNYALFSHVGGKACVFHPNENSYVNKDHLLFFEFVGKIVAKAVYEQQNLSAYFSRAFYKHILGRPVNESDMESFDPVRFHFYTVQQRPILYFSQFAFDAARI